MRKLNISIAVVIILLTLTGYVFATDNVSTLNKGQISLEFEREDIFYRNKDVDTIYYYYLYYGLADNLMLEITRPWVLSAKANGDSSWNQANTNLQLRYRFIDETRDKWGMMVKFDCDLEDGFVNSPKHCLADYGVTFVTSKRFENGFEPRLNLGYHIDNDFYNNRINYEVALAKYFNDTFKMKSELKGLSFRNDPSWLEINLALGINISKNTCFTVTKTWGLNNNAPKSHFDLDFSITF